MKKQEAYDNQAAGSMRELKEYAEVEKPERRWERDRRTKYVAGRLMLQIEDVLTQHRRAN